MTGAQLSRSKVQHAVPAADVERVEDALRSRGRHLRAIFRRAGSNVYAPTRRQSANKGADYVGGAIEGELCRVIAC